MSDSHAMIPDFIKQHIAAIYADIWEYNQRAADNFEEDFRKKVAQIEQFPFSCAVDTVYPSLIEGQIRKAIIFDDRYLLLYMVKDNIPVVLMVERAERDYITVFEANLKLYEGNSKWNGL
ncbi:MAG: type II toxin-antitoxin system RelE/ParE family toxin [Oscillospiraceae bacterium]|nr:type II toxin-antitoxin system RelE/ParE family toxin [Oscillospiraceae bacterium]